MPQSRTIIPFLGILATLAAAIGCSSKLSPSHSLHSPPEVRFDAPSSVVSVGADLVQRVSWTGRDPDGGALTYLVAVNPRSIDAVDGTWSATADRTHAVRVKRAGPLAPGMQLPPGREFDVIAVRARDRDGALSEPVARAFFGENVAPTVAITFPRPSRLLIQTVPSTIPIRWQGVDPDGPSGRPVKYKFKLIPGSDPEYDLGIVNPDSLRRLHAPSFAGWDSVSGDTTTITYSNLTLFGQYLFVITAIDDQGDYDPIFSLDKNLLRFRVGSGTTFGPILTAFDGTFSHTFLGGFRVDPALEFPIEVARKQEATIGWYAQPMPGSDIVAYRWSVDIADPLDETPRRNRNDLEHWSEWSLTVTSATVEFKERAPAVHRLFLEARDDLGFVTLAVVRIQTVPEPSFERELLIVDDTRRPTTFSSGIPRRPIGPWPGAAELDSFLYARGGFPWQGYPDGTTSQPGIFSGYDFDTLGTRTGLADLTVPLATLTRYRQVIWIVDPLGATYTRSGTDRVQPMTALRYMTAPGRQNSLASYLEQGGRLWILGGGAGYAATIGRNFTGNDVPTTTFSSLVRNELAPGVFMWEYPHWQSEFRVAAVPATVEKSPFPIGGHHAPDYSMFPPALNLRTAATDPLPPLRFNPGEFYLPTTGLEFLQRPNEIGEDRVPSRPITRLEATLDTIYTARGPGLPPPGPNPAVDRIVTPVMTCYRGADSGQVLFSGLDIWSWRRTQCVQLVDAVLQGVWRLSRAGGGVVLAAEEPEVESKRDRRP